METAEASRLIAGRYRLGAVIGRGGMGVVWRAHDELLSRDVAVKELVWPASMSEEERRTACRRATREARLAARLSHRNVIRVFDIAEEDGCPWIVLELVPHRSLRDLVADDGPLDPAAAAEVGLGILAALGAAHRQGIVHRDVKPANILIAPDRAVLTDFGIAHATETSALTTVTGALVGSPSYIPPERARGGESDGRGDLWGLGASLYAAVEGHGPFDRDGGALPSLLAVVAEEPLPPVHAGPLWPVIDGLLCKDPDRRLDVATAERMLLAAAATASQPGAVAPASAMASRSRRPRRPAVALVGTTALAIIAVSGTALGLSSAGSPPGRPAAAIARPGGAIGPQAAASAPRAAGTAPSSATGHRPSTVSAHRPISGAPHDADRTTQARPPAPGRPQTGKQPSGNASAGLLAVKVGSSAAKHPSGSGHPNHGLHLGQLKHKDKQKHPGGK